MLDKVQQHCVSLLKEKAGVLICLQQIEDELKLYRQATEESGNPLTKDEYRLDVLSNGTRQDGSNRDSLCSQPNISCPDEDDSWPGTVYAVDN